MTTANRRSSLFISLKNPYFDEERVIKEALTTPYDKVIKILNKVKQHLTDTNAKNLLIKDLDWVIQRISTHQLYNYEISDQKKELEEMSKNSHEVKSFFEYLNNYSEHKETPVRGTYPKSKTSNLKDVKLTKIKSKLQEEDESVSLSPESKLRDSLSKNRRSNNGKKSLTVLVKTPVKLSLRDDASQLNKKINPVIDEVVSDLSSDESEKNDEKANRADNKIKIFSSDDDDDNFSYGNNSVFPLRQHSLSIKNEEISEQILNMGFNIFDFESKIGRENVLVEGAKAIFDKLNLTKLISSQFLENFLLNVRDGYKAIPYHNDLHGFDVCQTISHFLFHTDIDHYLNIDDLDILSIVVSALMHDIGHPGYNNSFQVNSLSDIAITYNDKSVLENYHVSLGFKILRKPDCNILEKLGVNEFKQVRKRMIESILSTDMIFHAKVHSLVKNKLVVNEIKYGINIDKIVDKNSANLFEDQQDIINFLIHTADVSHNSKEFNISSKWTDLLMEEFWKQGDIEKSMSFPVSFLCDRNTAEVSKSQIGFIKSIIIPTFDTLVDLLPSLNYFRENVNSNLNKWTDIVELEMEQKNKEKAPDNNECK